MDLAKDLRGNPGNFKDVNQCQQNNSEEGGDCSSNMYFLYADTDNITNEVAEFYSYLEEKDLKVNFKLFAYELNLYKRPCGWQRLDLAGKKSLIMKLLDQLDISNQLVRMHAARCILYIAQGCWGEIQSKLEQKEWSRRNCMLLYDLGTFTAFVELFNFETEKCKFAVSLEELTDLRIILAVLYTITEVIRNEIDSPDYKAQVESFCSEINNLFDNELFVIKLFKMVMMFGSGLSSFLPIKKILLLLWKLLLVSLGGMKKIHELKSEIRRKYNLPVEDESNLDYTTSFSSVSSHTLHDLTKIDNQGEDFAEDVDEKRRMDDGDSNKENSSFTSSVARGVFWRPKVRAKDIDLFVENARQKFIGLTLNDDHKNTAGMPEPIQECVKTLKKYIHTSVGELQVLKEVDIIKNPMSSEEVVEMTPSELLYQEMLPSFQDYMVALMKTLLATIINEEPKLNPGKDQGDIQIKICEIDIGREKQIIVKAISAILLLLLKHFRLNHIFQFEFMCMNLVSANCIPLILHFFKDDITNYIATENLITTLEFPSCVMNKNDLNAANLHQSVTSATWRNTFSSINLLRILNKICKWKQSRILTLVVFKSFWILKQSLTVRNSLLQFYILKLLKMQSKYLKHKISLKVRIAMFVKVRQHLNDHWNFDIEKKSADDYEAEELALNCAVGRFNERRYEFQNNPEFNVKTCLNINGVLDLGQELCKVFKKNYEVWLEQEVFNVSTDWDVLLKDQFL